MGASMPALPVMFIWAELRQLLWVVADDGGVALDVAMVRELWKTFFINFGWTVSETWKSWTYLGARLAPSGSSVAYRLLVRPLFLWYLGLVRLHVRLVRDKCFWWRKVGHRVLDVVVGQGLALDGLHEDVTSLV